MKSKLLHITWTEIDAAVTILAWDQRIRDRISAVAGLPRGGLCPAVMLSHQLDVPLVSVNDITGTSADLPVLIVDDIYDSGKTMIAAREKYPSALFACLFTLAPNDWVIDAKMNFDKNGWLVFPWESKSRAMEDQRAYLERMAG